MNRLAIALAALAAIGFSGAAFAYEATTPKAMTDAEMDKVTAGASISVFANGEKRIDMTIPGTPPNITKGAVTIESDGIPCEC